MPYKKPINKKHPNFQELYEFEDIKVCTMFYIERPTNKSGYYPIVLCGRDQIRCLGNTSRLGSYELSNTCETIYTLRYYYATQVWNTAVAVSSRSIVGNPFLFLLPHWEERDDSFMKLVNNDKFTPELVDKFWKLMEEIANSGRIKVHEGYTLLNKTKNFWGGPDKCYPDNDAKFEVTIVIDADNVKEAKSRIKDIWNDEYNKTDKSFSWDEIEDLFKEVSLAQRELLNSHWMHRHNETDKLLFNACYKLDFEAVKTAIEKGANVNALDDSGESALQKTVEGFSEIGLLLNDDYSDEERAEIEKQCMDKAKEIVLYLVGKGADIDLYGKDGLTPLVCAYYKRSVEMIQFLLEQGADPNTNCYLTDDCTYWGYSSTILNIINEDIEEDYDDTEKEIEQIIKNAGGRLMAWGWNPEEMAFTNRPFICIWPNSSYIFLDNGYQACGDACSIRIERENQEPQIISLASIDDLKEWHEEFVKNLGNKEKYDWLEWRKRGFAIAHDIRKLLPDDVDLYYLFDTPTVFVYSNGYRYWNRDGNMILID